jgi:hypothetical protein
MRKLLLLVLMMLLATSVLSVSALGESDLTKLAAYVGDDALFFASTRTDDGLIVSLDTVVERIVPFLPRGTIPPGLNISVLLDQLLVSENIGTFDKSVRPWLGNSASLALFVSDSLADDPFVLVSVQVDGKAALEFFGILIADQIQSGALELSEENGFTLITSSSEFDTTAFAFGDDVLFIASHPDLLPLEAVKNPLSDNARFNDTLSQLPEKTYDMLFYSDMQALQRVSLSQASLGLTALPPFVEDLFNTYGGFALGFKLLNDEALVLDMVQTVDLAAYEKLGIAINAPRGLDYDFTNHIPDDAVLVLQSSEFGSKVQNALNSIRSLGDYIKANGGLAELIDPEGNEFDEQERQIINQVDLAWLVGATNLSFAGMTGLNLEREVLPVLDGDVAMYLSLTPTDDFMVSIVPNAALLFQSSDAEASIALVEQLGVSADAYELSILDESYGNGTALVLPSEDSFGFQSPGLDLVVASSDGILALGTRGAVNAVLDTDNGLSDNAVFQDASQYFIPDSQHMVYLATEPILDAVDTLMMSGDIPATDPDLQMGYRIISLIESTSITGTMSNEGVSIVRFAITLSEEPRPLPEVPGA